MTIVYTKGGTSSQTEKINGVESTGAVVHESLQLFFKFYIHALYKCLCAWYIHNKIIYTVEDPALAD